jgi:outer membrane protein assembly factor BamB
MTRRWFFGVAVGATLLASAALASAGDWPNWRGPHRDGTSDETGLISSWSPSGENLIWKADLTTRATPILFDGRACVTGRGGDDLHRHELVACFDAQTGRKLWERDYPVYNTTVPFSRVGWASLTGDPETGYVYAQNVDGQFIALDREGKTVWQRRLGEEFGRASGFGGRTMIPVVDEDQILVSVVGAGWGRNGPPRQRYYSFDKRTGAVRWTSTPATGKFKDANNNASPTVATIGGRRLLIDGGADGWLYALEARTGELRWKFHLSEAGLNVPPAVAGDVVYAAHSEENVDTTGIMGRVVAIDGTGQGDITKTGEIWRADALGVGFAAPTIAEGRVYVVDNAADLHALDQKTGKVLWSYNLGTIGRAAPTFADGKLYLTEETGHVHVVDPRPDGAKELDQDLISMPGGRFAEIWGSVAVAYGRVYFTAENGLYCLGHREAPFEVTPSPREKPGETAPAGATPARLLVVPAEVIGRAGEPVTFEAWAYDDMGRLIGRQAAQWTLEGLSGQIAADGTLTTPAAATTAGIVKGEAAGLEAVSQVRLYSTLPWTFDFEEGGVPKQWIGAGPRFKVTELDDGKRLHKPPVSSGLTRSSVYIGPPTMKAYTVEADLRATRKGRRMPDMGVINQGYTLDVMGRHQRVQIRTWAAHLEKAADVDFAVEPDVWYHAKLRVDVEGDQGRVLGKVWKKDEPEPAAWTVTLDDPTAVKEGSPGIYGDSPTDVYYDNVTVKGNE